jgi:hypothetical protein
MTNKNKDKKIAENSKRPSTNKKKVYSKPELVEHGSVNELTRFGGSDRTADFFGRRV